MPNTFELIASSTVGSGGVSEINFTSIPSTFTDLALYVSIRTNRSAVIGDTIIRFNGSTTGYTMRALLGDGVSASSFSDTTIYDVNNANNATANTFSNTLFYIPNYAGSTNKSVSIDSVQENNGTSAYAQLSAGLWSNTAAITSIKLIDYNSATILQHSTAYLYGVKNA